MPAPVNGRAPNCSRRSLLRNRPLATVHVAVSVPKLVTLPPPTRLLAASATSASGPSWLIWPRARRSSVPVTLSELIRSRSIFAVLWASAGRLTPLICPLLDLHLGECEIEPDIRHGAAAVRRHPTVAIAAIER